MGRSIFTLLAWWPRPPRGTGEMAQVLPAFTAVFIVVYVGQGRQVRRQWLSSS